MPELPEVENVARGLSWLRGRVLDRIEIFDKKVWFESELAPGKFAGLRVREVSRRGKYIIFRFSSGSAIVQHLRMTGKMLEAENPAIPEAIRSVIGKKKGKGLQIRCRLNFGDRSVVFYDTRRFGTLTAVQDEAEFFSRKGLAPDPFQDPDASCAEFMRRMKLSAKPAKAALLDQSMIAGVGNIYADEALHARGIHPRTPAKKIRDLRGLWETIQAILARSIVAGGTSIIDYVGADGVRGDFEKQLRVYGREGQKCQTCDAAISKITLAGRSTHFCPGCQRQRRSMPE
jgi:formamidopyrimidine-DNA glycosylase